MDSFTQLKSSIDLIRNVINLDISPAFDDLSNNSQIFNDLIDSQNAIKSELFLIETLIVSNLIKGDTGEAGPQGIQGLSYLDNFFYKSVLSPLVNSTTTLAEISALSFTGDVMSIYQITAYIEFSTASTLSGISLGLYTPTNSVDYVDISVPTTSAQSSSFLRMFSPNSNKPHNAPLVISTSVNSTSQKLTAIIHGFIQINHVGGLVKIMFCSEASGVAVTIGVNSKLFCQKVN